MRGTAAALECRDEPTQGGCLGETAIRYGHVDHTQIHRHDAARADVHVADLGVAHLTLGQTHIGPVGDEARMRAVCPEPVEVGRLGLPGRVEDRSIR